MIMEHEFIGVAILAVSLTIFFLFIIDGLKRRNNKQEKRIESLESVVRHVKFHNGRLHGKLKKALEDAKKLQAANETLQAENRKLSSEKMRLAEERIRSEKQKNEMLRMIDKRQASLSQYKKLLFLSMSGKEIPSEYLGKIMEME
jgi:uncharacterized protein YoxC